MKSTTKSFIAGLLLGAAGVIVIGAGQYNSQVAAQPEYKLVEGTVYGGELTLAKSMNKEAQAGWELVSVHPSQQQYGFAVMRKKRQP